MSQSIQKLYQYSQKLTDLKNTIALLNWDQETYLPPKAHEERGEQLATLSSILHELETSSDLGKLLEQSQKDCAESTPQQDKALLRVMQRNYNRATKLPNQFVSEFAKTISQAHFAWVEARKHNNFSLFAPNLEKVVSLNRQQAELLGYFDHPYDALLDLYEEGLTTSKVSEIFQNLKDKLIPLVEQSSKYWHRSIEIDEPLDTNTQIKASKGLLKAIGYDFDRGREDASAHPFTTTLGLNDRRVTNRYANDLSFIFSALHEGGHALYEQGISSKLKRTPLVEGVSLGIHESQSRLWENMIGRSRYAWQSPQFKKVKRMFPQLTKYDDETWYQVINHVHPSLIRTESDELTYNLHILIRFEIEKALIEGSLAISQVPKEWNAKYQQYLGIIVPDDTRGCLQDIHWSGGMIGYFPTYKILKWLTQNIYTFGSIYTPQELIFKATGKNLSAQDYIDYLTDKFHK